MEVLETLDVGHEAKEIEGGGRAWKDIAGGGAWNIFSFFSFDLCLLYSIEKCDCNFVVKVVPSHHMGSWLLCDHFIAQPFGYLLLQ